MILKTIQLKVVENEEGSSSFLFFPAVKAIYIQLYLNDAKWCKIFLHSILSIAVNFHRLLYTAKCSVNFLDLEGTLYSTMESIASVIMLIDFVLS